MDPDREPTDAELAAIEAEQAALDAGYEIHEPLDPTDEFPE